MEIAELPHYIDGQFAPPAGGAWLDDVDPARDRVVARIARGNADDVDRAVRAGQAALAGEWGQWTVEARARALDRIAEHILAQAGELARLESLDTGKPVSLAQRVDIPRAEANFRFFARAVRQHADEHFPMDGALNYTQRQPLGVVALITPWNLPLYLLSWKVAPALAMGNAVVCKPSELTPQTASALARIIDGCGLPPGAFQLLHGTGPEAGQALLEHHGVSGISFTGGTATGRQVAATAAPQFKKLSLELGGKNPTLVFDDADFDAAVEGAVRAGFTNQGQVCLCGSRLLVQRGVYDRFVAAFVERVRQLEPGDPQDPATSFGCLVSREHREKVEGYLQLAREEGGEILCGGDRPQLDGELARGAFLRPAVVTGLPPTSRCSSEEIFGPVVTVHPFDDEAEAMEIANGVPYGLAASVWTTNLARAHRVAARLESGMVWVNCWLKRDLRVAFGGMKESGVGREGGRWSLEFFSEARNICIELDDGGK